MDELNELDNLTTIGTNSRRGGQNFDLQHDVENQRFTVSDAFYAKHNLDNDGFKFHVGGGNIYLSIQPNEESISYKGREGSTKGKMFTSSTTSDLLKKVGLVGDINIIEVGMKSDVMYYRLENASEETEDTAETMMTEETESETEELV